ncbi:hypothetical protein B296_00011735 [Ensete ventricosum]|uniref:Uncharacterized protein n=1 Tax=Ensete ventricosum TaxID=4639 RepID=A0A427A664_ENSVE|nr:hypothetical protein B296_00011735 [Ensete ventricosum]
MRFGEARSSFPFIWRKILVRVELKGVVGGHVRLKSDPSTLLVGFEVGPLDCFARGCFYSSLFPTIRVSTAMKWFALYIISSIVVEGFSTKRATSACLISRERKVSLVWSSRQLPPLIWRPPSVPHPTAYSRIVAVLGASWLSLMITCLAPAWCVPPRGMEWSISPGQSRGPWIGFLGGPTLLGLVGLASSVPESLLDRLEAVEVPVEPSSRPTGECGG